MCSTNRIMTNHLVFGGLLLSSITGKSSYVIQMHYAILPKNEQKYTYSKMIQKLHSNWNGKYHFLIDFLMVWLDSIQDV